MTRTITLDDLFDNREPTVAGMIVSLGFGSANFDSVYASWAGLKVEAPFRKSSAANSGRKHGAQTYTQAGSHDLNKGIMNVRVEHAAGTVILLQASWKRGGSPIKDAALFLRLRVGAPLYHIEGKIPTSAENTIGDRFNAFQGYADIMTADELMLLGIQVNAAYRDRFMALDEVDECFNIHQMEAARQSRPQLSAIATPEGLQMREVPSAPSRRMIVRRRV